jgi:transposase
LRHRVGTVHKYLKRAEAAGVTWPLPEDWDEARIDAVVFPRRQPSIAEHNPARTPPDFAAIHEQLRSSKYVTLQLLWEEYRQGNPEGYRYSRFCELYQRWRSKLDVVLRQEHKAGEKMFVDWAGSTIPVYDRHTGLPWQSALFVAALGASSYTFAEATRDQVYQQPSLDRAMYLWKPHNSVGTHLGINLLSLRKGSEDFNKANEGCLDPSAPVR